MFNPLLYIEKNRKWVFCEEMKFDHFVGTNKMIDIFAPKPMVGFIYRKTTIGFAKFFSRRYRSPYIRPLAVSRLTYPEFVLIPWGFPFSGVRPSIYWERRE